MDIATIIGIILGLGSILGGIVLMTPDLGMFGSVSSFAIVFGGMIASVSVAFPLQEVMKLGAAMGAVFKGSKEKMARWRFQKQHGKAWQILSQRSAVLTTHSFAMVFKWLLMGWLLKN